jgi:hypothetical protein
MQYPAISYALLIPVFAAARYSAHIVQIEDHSDRLIPGFKAYRYHLCFFGCPFHSSGFKVQFFSSHSSYFLDHSIDFVD